MTNGVRIDGAETLEEKLAAIAVTLMNQAAERSGFPPDYADFRDAFRPHIQAELARVTARRRVP
jgi:hypothetical protein